jgi:hypothetical protein
MCAKPSAPPSALISGRGSTAPVLTDPAVPTTRNGTSPAAVGVIQWIEEHRIPVSYIAGTSMGGLVVGIYATGRHAGEVREVVEGIEWDLVIGGKRRSAICLIEGSRTPVNTRAEWNFELRDGLQLPSGFKGREIRSRDGSP